MTRHYTLLFALITLTSSSFAQFNCGDVLIDSRDGQSYMTKQIGSQCWMAKNLNIGVQVTSVDIGSNHTELTDNSIIEKFCYENDIANCDNYGGMYTWDELMQYDTTEGIQGICPDGWRLPTRTDWDTLINQFSSSTVSTDLQIGGSSGFEAELPGRKQGFGSFIYLDQWGFISSSSQVDSQTVYYAFYNYTQSFFWVSNNKNKFYAFSVRCLIDETTNISKDFEGRSSNDLNVYPNPAQDFVIIDYSLKSGEGPGRIVLYDLLGNALNGFDVESSTGSIKIPTPELPSGIYYYRLVTSKNISLAKKIIIVK